MSARKPVVFLDRDGTLNPDRPGWYLTRPSQMRVYRRAAPALRLLRRAGFRLVVVTNQSGLGRGYLTEDTLGRIHAKLRRLLAAGGARLDAIVYCPHHPDRRCACRKPKPLLARRAARRLGLDLGRAAVIGDKRADLGLARSLGVPGVLVLTGHGRHEKPHTGSLRPAAVRRDVLGAARWVVDNVGRRR
ncbi:MAG: HAD family hydrolase [Elusimicrobia bacterium]|nr:HAD family hydrolase [Elusimicrobiota bacterium]